MPDNAVIVLFAAVITVFGLLAPGFLSWVSLGNLPVQSYPTAVRATGMTFVLLVAGHLTLTRTPFGRQLCATGHSVKAAGKAGLKTRCLITMNADPYLYPIVTSGVIFLAVLLDTLRRRRSAAAAFRQVT